jgi:chemotaxis protein CheC
MTGLAIIPSVPELAIDMAGAILSEPMIEFGKTGDKALLIEAEFGAEELFKGYFILTPTNDSYARILNSLKL